MAITYRANKGSPLTNAEVDANFAQLANGSIEGFLQSGGTARSWISKARDAVSVKDFGAVGDGVTDDSAAFIDADDEDIGDIYVPDGTYIVEGIMLAGKKMFGPGTLKWKGSSSVTMLALADGASLEGLSFDGNASNQSSTSIAVEVESSPRTIIQGCKFTNFRGKIIQSDVADSPDCIVANNIFYNTGVITSANGVTVRSPRWIIEGNIFKDWNSDGHMVRLGLFYPTDDDSVPVTGCVVRGNIFKDHPTVGGAGVLCETYTVGASIVGNTFDTMATALKAEEDTPGVTYDISVCGNTFTDVTGTTATVSMNVPGVTFVGNTCRNMSAMVDFGDNCVCVGNRIDTVGSLSDTLPAIRQTSTSTGALFSNNIVINSPFYGIQAAGGSAVITGNYIKTTAQRAIDTDNGDHVIKGNLIDGCTIGVLFQADANGCVVQGNAILNAAASEFSFTDNDDFKTCLLDTASNVGYDGANVTRVIAGGVITVGRGERLIRVDTEGGAATDDLDTITASYIGHTIIVRSLSGTKDTTLKDGTGNLILAGDFTLSSTQDTITLVCDGTSWVEQARSDNA